MADVPETCEDRWWRCCDMDDTPADERDPYRNPEWYDRHVAAYYAKGVPVKYFRTVYEIEVLSNEPLINANLDEIAYQVVDGHASGAFKEVSREEVSAEQMAKLLVAQGSDPDFLIPEDEAGWNDDGAADRT